DSNRENNTFLIKKTKGKDAFSIFQCHLIIIGIPISIDERSRKNLESGGLRLALESDIKTSIGYRSDQILLRIGEDPAILIRNFRTVCQNNPFLLDPGFRIIIVRNDFIVRASVDIMND